MRLKENSAKSGFHPSPASLNRISELPEGTFSDADPGGASLALVRLSKWLVLPAALVLAVPPGLWWIGAIGGNFREVVPGRLYRSGQLDGDRLARTIRRYRLKSVLDLRGAGAGGRDYTEEVAVCRRLGVVHLDLRMRATRLPRPGEASALVAALDRLPRPLLVHCAGGADRAGLAATLDEAIEEGRPLDAAQAEGLTWRYGHLAFTQAGALDRFLDLYRRQDCGHGLRRWIADDYPAIYRRLEEP